MGFRLQAALGVVFVWKSRVKYNIFQKQKTSKLSLSKAKREKVKESIITVRVLAVPRKGVTRNNQRAALIKCSPIRYMYEKAIFDFLL